VAEPPGQAAPATGGDAGKIAPDQPTGATAKRDAELAATVTGYVDAFLNNRPVFTRDNKQVVFVSTRDGLPQPYIAALAGPATRIGATSQRIGQVIAAPGGKDVLFTSDTGADENWSYFRVGIDGTNLIELTPNVKLNRDAMFVPDGRPSQLYFTARAMAEARSTLYVTSATAPGEAKAIYTDDKTTTLRDVSADGKVALLRRYPSRSENHLLRVDVESGKVVPIFPPQGKVSIFEAVLSRDGKRALVATDNGAEQALLLSLDVRTGKQLAKRAFTPATAQIVSIEVAKEGGLVAVTLVVGTRSEIHIIDGRTLVERTTVAMPPGSGSAAQFSHDGKQLLVTWSTPDRPTDLFVIDPRTGKVTPRSEERPSLPKAFAIDASTIEVPAFDGGKIPTNVLIARGQQTKKHPVAVLFHGGPAGISSIRWSPSTAMLVAAGYVVVEPNIRGSTGFGRAFEAADNGAKRGDSFKDVETVTRWIAVQPWADKDRLVVMGGSWGGYLTLIALTRWPELWRAGIDLFGVVNLRSTLATTSGVLRQIMQDEIGDADKDAAFLDSISPITEIAKLADPLFVYAGANDPRVRRSESDLVVRALRSRRVPVEYMVSDNEGHSVARRETQIALYARVLRFLEHHLR
jgi:dipeptidyl aminopeptidase/acylaminoacyl peptidase